MLIGVPDELRQLEYSQRLAHRARNVLAPPGQSNGRALFDAALAGGSAALGRASRRDRRGRAGRLRVARPVASLACRQDGDAILDAWIFANGAQVDGVWVRGAKLVDGGRHIRSAMPLPTGSGRP